MYDLTVEEEHCFYAGDILVSNCGDAVQYLALHYNVQHDGGAWGRKQAKRTIKPSTYVYV